MTTTATPLSAAGNPIGFGRMLRKEDARFLRGRGNYLDDITMPGMLHGAILASPYAHARIRSIDTSAAEAHPKVKAVITGAMLEGLKLAWMPTLSADVQAVLATDKVRYQGQEVAFVIARVAGVLGTGAKKRPRGIRVVPRAAHIHMPGSRKEISQRQRGGRRGGD